MDEPGRRLNSWKEIAAHLNRTMRTAQRWERAEGLPVHRHGHDKRDSVYAYEAELEAWWASRRARLEAEEAGRTATIEERPRTAGHRTWLLVAAILVTVFVTAIVVRWLGAPAAAALPFAARDFLLVTDFDNNTGEPLFDKALLTAFMVSLQQSAHANILPRARVLAALARMGKSPDSRIDEVLGREICLREHARALIDCDLARAGRHYALAVRLLDPQSGETVRSYLEETDTADALLPAIGRVARRIRRDLGESLAAIRRSDRPLPQVTTPSLEALKLYSEGNSLWQKGEYRQALQRYESALKRDPEFAAAHAALGNALLNHVIYLPAAGQQHYEKALRLADRLTERERLSIQADYHTSLRHTEQAQNAFLLYLKAYPDDAASRYTFGTMLLRANRIPEAIEQFTEAARLDPSDARSLVNLATCYMQLNRAPEALPYYRKGFAAEPGWITLENLNHEYGVALMAAGQPDKARQVYALAIAKPEMKWAGLRSLGLLEMYQGKYRAARPRLAESALLAEAGQGALRAARSHLYLAILSESEEDRRGQTRELDTAYRLMHTGEMPNWLRAHVGSAFARAGQLDKAERLLEEIRGQADTENLWRQASLHRLEGELALARGEPARALALLQLADSEFSGPYTLEALARACEKAGDTNQAIAIWEKLMALSARALGEESQQSWIEGHARLAELYLARGDRTGAARMVGVLLRLWEDADPDLPLSRTIQRLARRLRESR